MLGIGAIVLFVGVLCLIGAGVTKLRAGRIAKTAHAKTGDIAQKGAAVAGEKGAISTEGNVVAGQLLTSPVTHSPCLYYEVKVTATWKTGDSSHTETITSEKIAAPFGVDDGSGMVQVDASKGGDFELAQSYRKKQSRGLMAAMTGRPLVFGDHGFSVPMGVRVGNRIIPDSADFEVTERTLAPGGRLYVNGKLDEQNRIGSPAWTSLILSPKSRDELLAGATSMSKYLLIGGAAASGVGAIVSAGGALMG